MKTKTKWELFVWSKEDYISLGYYTTESIVEAEMEAVKRARKKGINVPSVSVLTAWEKKNE